MASSKGIYGRITSAARPPKPGSPAFKAWNVITAANTWIYRRSGGRLGATFDGAPTLLLHHIGRKSGQERVAPLLYLPDGDDLVIVASWGGSPQNPAWFHNLQAAPQTTVQVGPQRRAVTARVADADERARLWPRLIDLYPAYDDYQARTGGREIPLVILSPR